MSITEDSLQPPELFKTFAEIADITINGDRPWDTTVHDSDAYRRILTQGSLGLGEAYMDGLWDCRKLDQFFDRLFRIEDVVKRASGRLMFHLAFYFVRYRLHSLQSYTRIHQGPKQNYHINIGNDVFEAMLDPTMSSSCACWETADTLEQAQLNKWDMICRKLELKKGESLLDIGYGWGGLAQYAAEHYGVEVVGITISKEQQSFVQELCKGLPVKVKLMDYRDLRGKFDKIASIEMLEHVGRKNFHLYFKTVSSLLDKHGLFLLQTSGVYKTAYASDPWITKYIFPNGKLSSAADIARTADGIMLIEDWHNSGLDYDRTLMAWAEQFERIKSQLPLRYDERFCRMWKYYLLVFAGFFRTRQGQSWQIVFSKRARRKGYRSIRDVPRKND